MKSKIKIFIAIAGVLLLQSCGITRVNYQRNIPYNDLEQYRLGIVQTDSVTLANISWKNFFQDEILKNYILKGLQNNLDVLKAEQNLGIAQSYLKQAKVQFLPNFGIKGSYGYTKNSKETFNTKNLPKNVDINFESYTLNGFLSWELDIWGKINSQRRAGVATYIQSGYVKKFIESQVIANIANIYYNLLALDAKKEVLIETISNREHGIEIIKALKEAGSTSEVGVKQYEALLYNAKSLMLDVDTQIIIQENALSVLLGLTPRTLNRNKLDTQVVASEIKIGVPLQLLSNRPDVLASEYKLINAFELSNVARASMLPSLSINGSSGFTSNDFDKLFKSSAVFTNIIGNLTQPIFNNRRLRTQKEVKLKEQQIAYIDYKKSILTAYKEVSDAYYNYNANDNKIKYKQKEAEALMLAVEYSEALQGQGMANYLEVVNAKANALVTQLQLIDIKLGRLSSMVNLYRSLGGGWEHQEVNKK